MFRLALIFFGGDALIRRWKIFFALGFFTLLTGFAVLLDLGDGVAHVASWVLGGILLVQGVTDIVVGSTHSASRRRLQMCRGLGLVVFSALILDFPWNNSLPVTYLFAGAFVINGLMRIAASLLIRYASWRLSNLMGWAYLLIALLLVTDWPLRAELNLSFCMGLALLAAAGMLMRGAWRLRSLPLGSRLAAIEIYQPEKSLNLKTTTTAAAALPVPGAASMVVHVWTAAHEMPERIRLPLIDRYIFALSRRGSVSTGHVALECGGLYISHHPRVRLTITQQNLLHKVQATRLNDHPGMWLPSYAQEAADTRPSAVRIHFRVFNPAYLASFWAAYRQDDTYNLTHRNCAVGVTQAIDAAVEGVFADKPFWRTLLRLAFHPDMWHAGSIRVRAESMAWTPGLALDYASAIRRLTDPRQGLRLHLSRWWRSRHNQQQHGDVGNS